jgi:hypothetical protein
MKNYGVKPEQPKGGRETLPAGGYVCQILSAKVEEADWGDTLVIAHDVCEGEFEGIFKRDFENNTFENKKWRGTFRLRLPKDDGSEYDVSKKRSLSNFMWALEESNPGFEWGDWSTIEKRLKGKKVGIVYRNKEWEYNGKTGWTTEAAGSDSVENIRAGKFYKFKDKFLPQKPVEAPTFEELDDSESDLPF